MPCDRVSWSWALVTPHPDPPSPPGAPTWLSDLLEPHPKVSPHPTSCPSDPLVPRGPGPLPLPPPGCSPHVPSPSPPPPQHKGLLARQLSAARSRLAHVTSPFGRLHPPPGPASCGVPATRGTVRGPHGSGAPRRALRRVTGLQRWSECGRASPALPPPDVLPRQPTGGEA